MTAALSPASSTSTLLPLYKSLDKSFKNKNIYIKICRVAITAILAIGALIALTLIVRVPIPWLTTSLLGISFLEPGILLVGASVIIAGGLFLSFQKTKHLVKQRSFGTLLGAGNFEIVPDKLLLIKKYGYDCESLKFKHFKRAKPLQTEFQSILDEINDEQAKKELEGLLVEGMKGRFLIQHQIDTLRYECKEYHLISRMLFVIHNPPGEIRSNLKQQSHEEKARLIKLFEEKLAARKKNIEAILNSPQDKLLRPDIAVQILTACPNVKKLHLGTFSDDVVIEHVAKNMHVRELRISQEAPPITEKARKLLQHAFRKGYADPIKNATIFKRQAGFRGV